MSDGFTVFILDKIYNKKNPQENVIFVIDDVLSLNQRYLSYKNNILGSKITYISTTIFIYSDGVFNFLKCRNGDYIPSNEYTNIDFSKIVQTNEIILMNKSVGKVDVLSSYVNALQIPQRKYKFLPISIRDIEFPELYLSALT